MDRTTVLLVGAWMWPWYQEACAEALESLGCRVDRFDWLDDFYHWREGEVEPTPKTTWAGLQNRLLMGPALWRINQRLLRRAGELRPSVIWFYNSTHIFPGTIRRLRRLLPKVVLVQYANDNPFGAHVKPDYWRHLKRAIPYFDVHFVYRHANEPAFRQAGARDVHLLRSYFIPGEDFRAELPSNGDPYKADVVFAGHFERDGRLEAMEAIAARGHRLNLFGGGWMKYAQLAPDSPLRARWPIRPVVGQEYRKAISGAKIALCFLSKVNRDTYTRRNFQIPAMRTFMLSEYSDDLSELFTEGVEAEYFRSREELLDKVDFYLRHETRREEIARRGHERVQRDGHDVRSRMRQFLKVIEPLVSPHACSSAVVHGARYDTL